MFCTLFLNAELKFLVLMQIDVKVDSPLVGQNLQDHISTYLGPFFVNEGASFLLDRDVRLQDLRNYFSAGTGPMTSSGVHAMGFFATDKAKSEGDGHWPDIQLIYSGLSAYKYFPRDFAHAFHVKQDIYEKYYAHAVGKDSFLIIVSLARPAQSGEIVLKSKNPTDEPLIDPRYLQNADDVQRLVQGVKKTVQLVETTPSFRKVNATFTQESFPGCENVEFRSDEYWECFVRHLSITLHHIVGTCAMGGSDEAVVDPELRVRGVQNVRVIDASVMPVVPVGNTNAPTVMIGERGAQFILDLWDRNDDDETTVNSFKFETMN